MVYYYYVILYDNNSGFYIGLYGGGYIGVVIIWGWGVCLLCGYYVDYIVVLIVLSYLL